MAVCLNTRSPTELLPLKEFSKGSDERRRISRRQRKLPTTRRATLHLSRRWHCVPRQPSENSRSYPALYRAAPSIEWRIACAPRLSSWRLTYRDIAYRSVGAAFPQEPGHHAKPLRRILEVQLRRWRANPARWTIF